MNQGGEIKMRKFLLMLLAICITTFSCQARTSELVGKGEGYGPYNGWVVADMSMNDGVVSEVAAYSMHTFKDYGLVPVALLFIWRKSFRYLLSVLCKSIS